MKSHSPKSVKPSKVLSTGNPSNYTGFLVDDSLGSFEDFYAMYKEYNQHVQDEIKKREQVEETPKSTQEVTAKRRTTVVTPKSRSSEMFHPQVLKTKKSKCMS